jgi:thiol-disulfide isomerase/thioredoxin
MIRPFAAVLLALTAFAPLAASAALRAGDPEPALTFPTAVGNKTLALAAYKGKPVYLNFFATWCPPCNSEAPAVGKLASTYAKRGLAVIGVDELESAPKAQSFMTQYHLSYPAVLDADGGALRAFGGFGLPVHVFIARNGTVKLVHIGEMSPAEIEAAIKSIL